MLLITLSTYDTITVQHSRVQYSTVQYSTVQHSTVQYSTVQYSATIWYRGMISISYNQIYSIGIISKLLKNLIDYGKDHLLPIEH